MPRAARLVATLRRGALAAALLLLAAAAALVALAPHARAAASRAAAAAVEARLALAPPRSSNSSGHTNTAAAFDSLGRRMMLSPGDGAALRLRMYLWHVRNPAAVLSGAEAPALEQRGPYTYRRDIRRTPVPAAAAAGNATGDDDDGTLFTERETFTFLRAESCAGCSDDGAADALVLNVPFLGAAAAAAHRLGFVAGRLLLDYLTREYAPDALLFARRSAADLAFGYEDPLLAKLAQLDPSNSSRPDTFMRGLTGRDTAAQSAADAAAAGPSRIRTRDDGDGESYAGEMLAWRGAAVGACCTSARCPPGAPAPPWHPASAAAVRGSDAAAPRFPPGAALAAPGARVRVWAPEALRSVALVADAGAATSSVRGIDCVRFRLDDAQFTPAAPANPAAAPYDLFGAPGLTGNMSACAAGTPLFASAPHFLGVADAAVAAGVTGLAPDAAAHGTFADIEPRTGLALRGASRTQLSLPVGPIRAHHATWLPTLRPVPLFPVAWFELSGEATADATWPLRLAAAAPDAAATAAYVAALAAALGAVAAAAAAADGGAAETAPVPKQDETAVMGWPAAARAPLLPRIDEEEDTRLLLDAHRATLATGVWGP